MFAGQAGQIALPANGCPDALVFVGRDGHPVGAAADQNTQPGLAAFHSFGNRVGKIGIVNRVAAVGAQVFYCEPLALEEVFD